MKTTMVQTIKDYGHSALRMAKSATGFIQTGIKLGLGLIGLAVLFSIAAGVIPFVLTALTNLSQSGIALAFLFGTGGIIALLVGVYVLVSALKAMGFGGKGGYR